MSNTTRLEGSLRPKISWKKRALFAVAIYFVLGSACDHVIYSMSPTWTHFGRASSKPYLPYALSPNFRPNFVHRLIGMNPISTNELSYNDGPFPIEKPAGGYRIVCLGGSTTFSPAAAPYPKLLEERFEGGVGGHPIEVWNASMNGYSIAHAEVQIRKEFLQRDVDMVLVSEQWNYHRVKSVFGESVRETSWLGRAIGSLPLYSHIAHIGYFGRFFATRGKPAPDAADELEGYMEVIERIHRLTQEHGIQLVLGVHPDAWDEIPENLEGMESFELDEGRVVGLWPKERIVLKRHFAKALRAYAAEHALPFVDWERIFRERIDNADLDEIFQESNAHVYADGSAILAEIAFETILPVVQAELGGEVQDPA